MKLRFYLVFAVGLLLISVLTPPGQTQEKRGPSTPEERERAVKIARALEADPLNKKLTDDREWLLRWIIEIPDISVNVCTAFTPGLVEDKKGYSSEIFLQSAFSQAAFAIQHPDEAKDDHALYLAGLEGTLKVYEAIIKKDPGVRRETLDDLLKLRAEGKIGDFVRERLKGCQESPSVKVETKDE